jgi:hypothetical protein
VLPLDTTLGALRLELNGGEFACIVSAQHTQVFVRLHLNFGLKFVQCSKGVSLGGEQCNPHVPALEIHKQKKIFLTTGSHRRNQAAKISMVRIQQTLHTPLCQRQEGAPLQFGGDVINAEMVDVLDAG